MNALQTLVATLLGTDEEERSQFEEALCSAYLREITIPLIQTVLVILIVLVGGVGEFVRFIFPEDQFDIALTWRFYICFILGVLVIASSLTDFVKRWINWIYGVSYVLVSFISGYYLSQLRVPYYAGMYIVYLIPLITIMMPAKLKTRSLVTSMSLFILPGMYLSLGWDFRLFVFVFTIVSGSCLLSIILGHRVFYRLNREAFFDDRELSRRQQKIEFLARHDQLTGIYNRREFENKLEEEIKRSSRYESPLSLLMIDLDHFKDVNDTYGHPAGDRVLEEMGELLSDEARQAVRVSDIPGRYGGEEFCLLLPETRAEGASTVGNRIRQELSETEFSTDDGRTFTVTCSIGVASTDGDMSHAEELIQAADDALYEAKNTGRDKVIVHRDKEAS